MYTFNFTTMKLKIAALFLIFATNLALAQSDNGVMRMDEFRKPVKRSIIIVPNIDGYQTLKCDFHMHTVFSDGHVWPDVRVQEAWQEGLDAISITDHVEYHPHSKDVAVDHNRPYEISKEAAARSNILFVKGTEITRSTPPGHFNALFIGDASDYIAHNRGNEMDKEAVSKAAEQNAFIFWNHPGWKVNSIEGSYEWIDFVDELYNERMLHGIEVFNGFGFHKKALDWCIDKGLTVIGTSDMHNLIEHGYDLNDIVHRSMTLVFAEDRTLDALREALEAGRTVAWASKYLAGKEELLSKLFYASVSIAPSHYSRTRTNNEGEETVTNSYEISNNSDLYFELELKSGIGTENIVLSPRSSQNITARAGQQSISYEVVTAFVRSDKHLLVNLPLK